MKTINFIKNASVLFAITSMVAQPLAMAQQAKRSNVSLVRNMLTSTGLNNRKRPITVGEFFSKAYKGMKQESVDKIYPYILILQDQKFPVVDTTTFTDSKKIEQVRMVFQIDKKTFSIETTGYGSNLQFKLNDQLITRDSKKDVNKTVAKLARGLGIAKSKEKGRGVYSASVAPTREEWNRMTRGQKMKYLMAARYLMEDIQRILPLQRTKGRAQVEHPLEKYALVFEMLTPLAWAIRAPGNPCLNAGWSTIYNETATKCAGDNEGWAHLKKNIDEQWKQYSGRALNCTSQDQVPCNPVFYGFKNGGQPYCTDRHNSGKMRHVSRDTCDVESPLKAPGNPKKEAQNIQRILDSQVKALGGKGVKVNEDLRGDDDSILVEADDADFALVEKAMKGLDEAFRSAMKICDADAATRDPATNYRISNYSPLAKVPEPGSMEDQRSACDTTAQRYFKVQRAQVLAGDPEQDASSTSEAAAEVVDEQEGCPLGVVVTPLGESTPVAEAKPLPQAPAPVEHRTLKETCPKPSTDPNSAWTDQATKPDAKNPDDTLDDGEGFNNPCKDDEDNFRWGWCVGLPLALLAIWKVWDKDDRDAVVQPTYDPVNSPVTPVPPGTPGTPENPVTPTPPVVQPPPAKEGGSGNAGSGAGTRSKGAKPGTPSGPAAKPGTKK